jgi:hypothetical protein
MITRTAMKKYFVIVFFILNLNIHLYAYSILSLKIIKKMFFLPPQRVHAELFHAEKIVLDNIIQNLLNLYTAA